MVFVKVGVYDRLDRFFRYFSKILIDPTALHYTFDRVDDDDTVFPLDHGGAAEPVPIGKIAVV